MALTSTQRLPWANLWPAVGGGMLQFAFPAGCPMCGATIRGGHDAWCERCDRLLARPVRAICTVCRRYAGQKNNQCPQNCTDASPPLVTTLGIFDSAWRAVVHALKYSGDVALAGPLGRQLARLLPPGLDVDLIVPVPTDPAKRRQRGFGHAEALAQGLAQALGRPCSPGALTFTRRVADQTRLAGSERITNLDHALRADPALSLHGRNALIVDDVMTTGATIREVGRALGVVGANAVHASVLCVNMGFPGEL